MKYKSGLRLFLLLLIHVIIEFTEYDSKLQMMVRLYYSLVCSDAEPVQFPSMDQIDLLKIIQQNSVNTPQKKIESDKKVNTIH